MAGGKGRGTEGQKVNAENTLVSHPKRAINLKNALIHRNPASTPSSTLPQLSRSTGYSLRRATRVFTRFVEENEGSSNFSDGMGVYIAAGDCRRFNSRGYSNSTSVDTKTGRATAKISRRRQAG